MERFTYPREAWEPAPRKVLVPGRLVRAGGFACMNPHLVCLTHAGGGRFDLLVVPPEADALTGARALRMSGRRGGPRTPQLVLAAAGSYPAPEVAGVTAVRAG